MKHITLALTSMLIGISITLTGCSTAPLPIHQVHTKHRDGTIISLTSIKVLGASPHLRTYKMMYWSHDIQTEAFVSVPKAPGIYPLLVNCHGGYDTPNEETHAGSPVTDSMLSHSSKSYITLIPEYRGYAGSGGTVPGFNGITQDTNNAIDAIEGKYHVKPGYVYLEGASMGGGVVLKLATERHDIRTVIALSPFVGWDITGIWAMKNKPTNALANNRYEQMTQAYGPFKPNSRVYLRESINYQNIHVPTLLLQGTGDSRVPWQTVQTFYNDLKKTNPQVKLELFPGGKHGLHQKYQKASNQATLAWYRKYS